MFSKLKHQTSRVYLQYEKNDIVLQAVLSVWDSSVAHILFVSEKNYKKTLYLIFKGLQLKNIFIFTKCSSFAGPRSTLLF